MADRGRRAFITGAQRGIGRAIASALACAGFRLILNDLQRTDALEETAEVARAAGAEVAITAGDIADLAGQERLVAEAWSAFDGIDCLVNNAGISVARRGDMLEATPESFDRLMAVNLRGPFFLTQTVARRMTSVPGDGFRCIVTISSLNAEAASPDRAEYCIAKTGLAMMSKLYALRLAAAGIHAYEVRPGIISTDMTAVAREKYDRLFATGGAPMARWGEPADVGRAVAMLASGAMAYSTGEVVHVDGGLSVARL